MVARRRFELLSRGPKPHMPGQRSRRCWPLHHRATGAREVHRASQRARVEGFPLSQHRLREAVAPLPQEGEVVRPVAEFVGKHEGDLLDDRVPPPTRVAGEQPLGDLGRLLEDVKGQGVGLADRAREDLHQAPFHSRRLRDIELSKPILGFCGTAEKT